MRHEAIAAADGATINLHSVGSGPGLVVLHGAGVTVRDYRRLAERLAPHFTVHLFNRRGRSDSAALTGTETAQTDLDDVAAVLAHTGARNLFGHSGGGFVALRAGLTLPLDRIATYDAAVALESVDFPREFIGAFEEAVAAGDTTEAFVQVGQVDPDAAGAKLPHRVQSIGVRLFLRTPPGKQMLELLPTIGPEVRRILGHEGPAAGYSSIDAEVLLAYGSRSSRYFKDTCAALVAVLPNARALEIPRATHNTANTAPGRLVDPLIEFFADARLPRD